MIHFADLTATEARALRAEDREQEYRRDLFTWEIQRLNQPAIPRPTPAQRRRKLAQAITYAVLGAIATVSMWGLIIAFTIIFDAIH